MTKLLHALVSDPTRLQPLHSPYFEIEAITANLAVGVVTNTAHSAHYVLSRFLGAASTLIVFVMETIPLP